LQIKGPNKEQGPKGSVREREKDHAVKRKREEENLFMKFQKEKEKLCEEDI
jgi:hypothetical protein